MSDPGTPGYAAGQDEPTGPYPPPSGPPPGYPPPPTTGGQQQTPPPPPSSPPATAPSSSQPSAPPPPPPAAPSYQQPASAPPPVTPAYQPAQYPQYGFAYGAPPVIMKTNGLAIASMISGIAGMFLCILFVPSILAVVFGHVSLNQIKNSGGHEQGKGMAMAGLILGYLAIAIAIVWIIIAVASSDTTTY